MLRLSDDKRYLLSQGSYMAAAGWAIIAAVMILARLGLWAFWPVLLVIGLLLTGLSIAPPRATDDDPDPKENER